jgi:uncharacterized phage protein gp47/JayE
VAAPRALDYTALDYDAILAELAASAAATPELEGLDLSPGSPDRRFFSAVATVGAKLSYLQNRSLNEAFLARARLRQSVIDHAAGIAYDLSPPSPAVVSVTITLPRSYPDPVSLPEGTEIPTDDGSVIYTLDADVTMPAGTTSKVASATEGRRFSETATGESSSTSPAGQRLVLAESPVAAGSDAVTVDGAAWTRVRTFLSSTSADLHYRIERDGQDVATIVFGDGVNGRRPPESSSIVVNYRTTLGTRGRVRRGRLRRLSGSFSTTGGLPVEPTVNNPGDSSGGTDRETIEHARYAAPEALRATTRTVAREDYELHAQEVSGVARALCHTRIEDAGLPLLMHRVYVVPTGGGTADAALLTNVETYLTVTKPCVAGIALRAVSAVYRTQTVSATIYARANTNATTLRTDAIAAVRALFDPSARDADGNHLARFGHCVPRSAIDAALQDLARVTRVALTSPSSDAAFAAHEFPALASEPSITVLVESA